MKAVLARFVRVENLAEQAANAHEKRGAGLHQRYMHAGVLLLAAACMLAGRADCAAQTEIRFPDAISDIPGRLPAGVDRTTLPAALLLQALGLANPQDGLEARYLDGTLDVDEPGLSQFARRHGVVIRRLEVPRGGTGMEHGTGILRTELSDRSSFHLIYTAPDCLIAVFPAGQVEREPGAPTQSQYFDFTPYYFDFPQNGDDAMKQWVRFATLTRRRRDIIRAYMQFMHIRDLMRPAYEGSRKPYVYASVDAATDRVNLLDLDPEEFLDGGIQKKLEPRLAGRSTRPSLLFPVFPTVYSPAREANILEDEDFGTEVYQATSRLGLREGDAVLDIGTGTGYLAWLAWATAKRTGASVNAFALDINPVAVANARVLAQIAGFPLTSRVYDNVISAKGEYAFPGRRFRYVIWNMPGVPQGQPELPETYSESVNSPPRILADYWDGGSNGLDALDRFAPAVPGLLDAETRVPDGREGPQSKSAAIIWNLLTPEGSDIVGPAFRKAGLDADLLKSIPSRGVTCIIYLLTLPAVR